MGGSGSGKTNLLQNVIKHQRSDVDKTCLYLKEQFETKYQLVFNRRENLEIKYPPPPPPPTPKKKKEKRKNLSH